MHNDSNTIEADLPRDSTSAPTLRHLSQRKENLHSHRILYTGFCSSWFTMAKNWKLPKGPSVGEWLKQLWFIHTLEYYPAVKRNQQLMNLKGIKLSEKIQS